MWTSDIKILDKNKPLIFVGDHHGNWRELFWIIQQKKINNCYLISVGDSGIGFKNKKAQDDEIDQLNEKFKKLDIHFMSIRGNHDDPDYFKKGKYDLSNLELIEDYTVKIYDGKLIHFIGGAISIDRSGRRESISYWSGEGLIFDKEKLHHKVDILVTHTAPSWCFPQQFNEMVYGWAREDAYLLEDLSDERAVMDEILKICKPSLHLYGHFHSSWTEEINGCKHKLLNINEMWEPPR